jgi:hypothetical protein
MAWTVLHVVVTIIRIATHYRSGVICSVLHIAMQDREDGEGGGGRDCQSEWGKRSGQMKSGSSRDDCEWRPVKKVPPQRDNAHCHSRMKESRDWLTRCVISMTSSQMAGKGHLFKARVLVSDRGS